MPTLCRTYASETAAHDAVEALRTDVGAARVRLLPPRRIRDIRREPVGGFAGQVPPEARVGDFGNRSLRRWRGCGAFAGDADAMRQGSFGDAERVEVTVLAEIAPPGAAPRQDHVPSAA